MKYCPVCHERFDEDVIQFCTKDGTPLLEETPPNFTGTSQEGKQVEDDFGDETVIRRKPPVVPLEVPPAGEPERIIIPTSFPPEQQVRPRAQVYYPPPEPQQNTVKTVVLTILGTLVVLGFGAGLFWLLQKEQPANIFTNINTNMPNQNVNLNSNMGFDANFNFNTNFNTNTNSNFNFNMNLNANLRTPSPTATPRTSPSPIPSPSPITSPITTPTRPANVNRPVASPTMRTGPRPPTMTGNRPPTPPPGE